MLCRICANANGVRSMRSKYSAVPASSLAQISPLLASRISSARCTCGRWNMLALVISTIFSVVELELPLDVRAGRHDLVEVA